MNTLSKDQKVKNAIKDINALETAEAVQVYIAGEIRLDVLDAAKLQIELIEKTSPTVPASESPPLATEALPQTGQTDAGAAPLPPVEKPMPENDKDTTHKWVKTLAHLQPKQGEVDRITQLQTQNEAIKGGVIQKEERVTKTRIMTIRDGRPVWVHFDEEGQEIRQEKIQ